MSPAAHFLALGFRAPGRGWVGARFSALNVTTLSAVDARLGARWVGGRRRIPAESFCITRAVHRSTHVITGLHAAQVIGAAERLLVPGSCPQNTDLWITAHVACRRGLANCANCVAQGNIMLFRQTEGFHVTAASDRFPLRICH